ncbi:methionyl-tRNA formyltransferase [Alkalibacillus almallahensis]|uniref:methionyl-tRNA formyltransferase n=1 Tax=Alkalibacillus almallahensis TaxID=1379154 RepID=UPI001FBA3F05|nr:methionyl-tRNA formyltransferase [Alkalibacillus almallahensis]NIK12252.1 methionyl-tRNA formyltransferase [Alkalibacillus almallahensis]
MIEVKNVIIANHDWYHKVYENLTNTLDHQFYYISDRKSLTYDYLSTINPRYIFIPHWSFIIPQEVYENFECIVFHMTDLPYGRGGTPLQNLISRGIYETKLTAIRCEAELDAGPIYLKKDLNLHGSAEEIYMRAAQRIEQMIQEIIETEPTPYEQVGEVVSFSRRKRTEGDLKGIDTLEKAFDYIRMLDATSYPRAYLETAGLLFEFERASLKEGYIHADVKITRKEDSDA